MADKIYIKASVKTSKYGLNLSGKAEEVIQQIKEHTNEKGYFNWEINPRKEIGKYGETHSVTVNQWKPAEKPNEHLQAFVSKVIDNVNNSSEPVDDNSLPF